MKMTYRNGGEGPPLVILHGLFGSKDNWWGWASKLEGFSCWLPDLRNHGDSPWEESMSFPLMAQDVLEFLDDHKIEKAILMGHSMGGKVAMETALRWPHRVERLIVVDMAPKSYPPRYEAFIRAMLHVSLTTLSSRAAVQEALEKQLPIDRMTLLFLLKSLGERPSGEFYWKIHLQALLNNWEPLWNELNTGRECNVPVLFAYGSKSDFFLMQDRTRCIELFPQSRFESVEGASHWVHADKPQELKELVQRFLRKD